MYSFVKTKNHAKKVNAKVGSIMADNWADKAGNINSNSEFAMGMRY
jgi:hypothetical protein